MIIIGFITITLGLVFFINGCLEIPLEGFPKVSIMIFLGLFLIIGGLGQITYDIGSPTEITLEKTYITNQLNNITFSEVMLIKEYRQRPTRFLALTKDLTTYEVRVFKGEE